VSDEIRLLLVEDNPDDAELLKLELERGGFQLDWSRVDNDGDMRRALGERQRDLIISDFSMPGFGGFRALDVAQEISRDVPFIFVSGALGEERAVEAIRAGARDYIVKTRLDRLPAAVRRELATPPRAAALTPTKALREVRPPELDSLERFSHDLNNYLAVIFSYGRMAQRNLDENSTPHGDVEKMLEAARLAEALAKEMLMLSQRSR
jgi:DNA-binding response OmpR family regulator